MPESAIFSNDSLSAGSRGRINYFSPAVRPVLEIKEIAGRIRTAPFTYAGPGRTEAESHWVADPLPPGEGRWEFRIDLGGGAYDAPPGCDFYGTDLDRLWLQDGQIFAYPPAAMVSPSRVIKIPQFSGSLSPRDLYVYLPRGYTEHQDRDYPVIYMHDGQNCFEAFGEDSFAGSWRADEVADRLIGQGRMQECLIVGVSNGREARMSEYLPPYVRYRPPAPGAAQAAHSRSKWLQPTPLEGRAGQTAAYYQDEVAPFIRRRYRVRPGRNNTATCGSSMGGLFSTYLAWERTDFARHHAALSPAYWITAPPQGNIEIIERLRTGRRRDIRLWLDSGTLDTAEGGDDGMPETLAARDALRENGYVEGQDFCYYLDEGAIHNEAAWAARLPLVFQFLFPVQETPQK